MGMSRYYKRVLGVPPEDEVNGPEARDAKAGLIPALPTEGDNEGEVVTVVETNDLSRPDSPFVPITDPPKGKGKKHKKEA